MNHCGTQTLHTERLTLRRFCEADQQAMFRNWHSDSNVTTYLRWPTATDPVQTRAVLREWIDGYCDPAFYQWAIVLDALGEPIGSISVVEQNQRLAILHIGYCIGSRWWHKGITTEAFAAVIPYLFETVGANRIESQHDPDNPNSGKVMHKCGLTYEGTLRQADFNNRGIVDACMYSLLASEYFATKRL